MRFTAEITLAERCRPSELGGPVIAELARAAEESGFDAISFNDHPIPSRKWLGAGGHDAHDPVAVHAYCAAVTERIRVIPYLVVLPYRDPALLAKAFASLDVLSGGRTVAALGAGYLGSEFGAVGVPFEERNARFDEGLDVMRAIWRATDGLAYEGEFSRLHDQVSTPPPIRHDIPVWIGGNGAIARERVARAGDGWAPLVGVTDVMSKTVRTAPLPDLAAFGAAMADLRSRCDAAGRDWAAIEVQAGGGPCAHGGADTAAHRDWITALGELGATQHVVDFQIGGSRDGLAELRRFGEQIVSRLS